MEFPVLDTEVHVQYSAAKVRAIRHQAMRFLGDTRQGKRHTISSGERWRLRYESLNAVEMNRLRSFFEANFNGTTFTFADPWTGSIYAACRFGELGLLVVAMSPGVFRVQLEVEDAS
jgi:hypothetical protein